MNGHAVISCNILRSSGEYCELVYESGQVTSRTWNDHNLNFWFPEHVGSTRAPISTFSHFHCYTFCGGRDYLFSTPIQTCPGAHPASCTKGTVDLSRGQSEWGVAFTTHFHLTHRLRMKGAVHLLLRCACMVCYGEIFTFTFITVALVTLLTCSKQSVPAVNRSLQDCIYAIEECLEISNANSLLT